MRRTLLLLGVLWLGLGCRAEAPASSPAPVRAAALDAPAPDTTSQRLFDRVMAYARAERLHTRPFGEIVQAVGVQFLGTPYVAGTLDAPSEETLLTDLTGFDCVLFVETALAMARGIAVEDYTYDAFARHILDQRYRGGAMDGYCSRLHYFTEWIADNAARGTVEDVTEALGGRRLGKALTFMSEHRDAYPRLATNDSLFRGIQDMERQVATLQIYYIPQDRIGSVYARLQPGDIIATATDINGLDVTHSGLVFKGDDGITGFLHASTSGGVKVSPDLQAYVTNNKRQVGIVVARPVDPRTKP